MKREEIALIMQNEGVDDRRKADYYNMGEYDFVENNPEQYKGRFKWVRES